MEGKRIKVWVQAMTDRPHLVLQWHDPETGKRRSKSAGTSDPKEAEAKRGDLEADLNAGRHQDAVRMAWERFVELYDAEHLSGVRPGTRAAALNALANFRRLSPGVNQLRQVTTRTCSSYVAALRKDRGTDGPKKPSTLHTQVAYLHGALAWAHEQGFLPQMPTMPTISLPRKVPQPVALEAWEKLVTAAGQDEQMRAFLLCGWLAGLRLAETYHLSWTADTGLPWLDLPGRRIVLPGESVKGKADQEVPLDPALEAALRDLPRRDGDSQVFRFPSHKEAGKVVEVMGVGKRIIRLARSAGVTLTMRSLRRGFGCRYAGHVPAQVLQRLMRHSSITTTVQFYANVDAAAREAILGPDVPGDVTRGGDEPPPTVGL